MEPGSRLGPYEVTAPIGAGGMGEVWRARDTRLGRDVAVKVLPEAVANDPERLSRFEKEARAVAAMNHPNILTVYDVGSHDGTPYVVMELLEGETLREVVSHRSPTPRQVLAWGVAIAQGLSAAHRKGIVHRDLKPENLFLTADGRIKILDFGLAKQTPVGAASPQSSLPTESAGTDPGVVLGTIGYMSPEQVRGRPVDPRSDLFSFGAILYELLTGRRAFRGETPADTMTAILTKEPPGLSEISRAVPPGVERIVGRCLEKRPEERFQTAHDLALALEAVLERPSVTALLDVEERSPYPGLSFFTEEDAGRFFGREDEVKALWEKLRSRRLLALIGPSGAGKTSFVRAGVAAGRPDGWAAIVSTPGRTPLRGLGQALGPELSGDPEALRKIAGFEDPDTAFELLARWRRSHGEALVVVDQFEELFTLNDAETQGRFAALLGRLAGEADVHVFLSMRDDFLMRCHDHAALSPVFGELTPLGPMTREALRRAVVEPAAKQGYRFEDEALVEEILNPVEGVRGSLPLLAFAVSRLWERRDREKKLLTREACREIGGVEGALAQHAEATLDRIGPEREGVVREIFRNLTTAQGTRGVLDREELLSAFPDRAVAESVLGRLIDSRLLTSWETEGGEGEPGRHRVEIVHESLLRAWPRLVRWQTQDADGAQLRDQLRQAAHLWKERGGTEDLLWTGASYLDYRAWRERYPGGLSSVEEEFAKEMSALASRRRRRRRAAIAAALAALAVGLGVVSVLWRKSARETRRAEAEAARAEAGKLLSLGRLKLADSPNAAIAYSIASLERSDSDLARRFAVEALWQGPPALFISDPVVPTWATRSPDGRWLALGGPSGLAFLNRETGERRQLGSTMEIPAGFTSDGRRLVTKLQGAPTVLHVWEVPEGRLERTLEHPEAAYAVLVDDQLLTFAFDTPAPEGERPLLIRRLSLDGKTQEVLGRWEPHGLRDWDVDPTGTWIFSVQRGRLLQQRLDALSAPGRLLGTHEGEKVGLSARPWSDRVVTGDGDGNVKIWDVPSARLERTLKSPASARVIGLDPKGRFLATGPAGGMTPRSMFLFDLAAPRTAEPVPLLYGMQSWLNLMEFSPDGSWLASIPGVMLWNMAGPRSTVLGRQGPPSVTVAFTRDGHLLSTSDQGVLRCWPLSFAGGEKVRELWSRPGAAIGFTIEVDPGGRFVVVAERLAGKVHVVPLDGSRVASHQLKGRAGMTVWTSYACLDPSGRFLVVTVQSPFHPELNSIRILDLAKGEERTLDTHPKGEDRCEQAGSADEGSVSLVWLRDGRLVSDGDGGLRVWNLETGTSERLRPCRKREGSILLISTPDSRSILRLDLPAEEGQGTSLSILDLASGTSREITSLGNRIGSFALDASGTILVTGDFDGLVRVGPLTGEEPHLLFGHTGPVLSVAVSPDGRLIASGSNDGTIRLWPMPDLSKPPLHTLPLGELLAKLKSLTNLRAVRDAASDTGWKIEIGPFPGWKDVPVWEP